MIESRLTYLFQAYFNKTATPNERDELMELLAQAENDEQVKTLLAETWQQFKNQSEIFNDSQGEEMLANILQKGTANKQVPVIAAHKWSFSWLRIAAAAAILFLAVTGVYLWLKPKQPGQQIAQSKNIPKDAKDAIVPGGNKAILTLSDGSNIVLDSTHRGNLAKQGNAKVMKLNTATLAYKAGDQNSQEIVYNTLSTPSGGQYQLILPDNTRVWLNASSSIHFPTIFKGKERNVTVTGEAYFEVAKNAAMPFKITVKDVEVRVLGTHFNIMAYNDENSMNTTLLEGSIKVSKGSLNKMLVPGQESRINKTGDINVVEANIEEVMAWKNGWFQFNAYDIEKVMRQISRWYDVEIVYEGKIPTGHFSGIVSRGNDISQVLKIMQAGGVRFRIEGRKVVILS
jgi:transmembrane sensor